MSKDEKKNLQEQEMTETAETVTEEAEEQVSETSSEETPQADSLQKKYDELYDKHLRTLAEYENYKRRTQKEKTEIYRNAQADALINLLPVLDDLERAAATEEESPLAEGVRMVYRKLVEVLGKMNVSEIEAVGKPFDPNIHNAVMHTEDEDMGENLVAEQFAKGYQMGDKVLRHSMVRVVN